ncbi:MAG: SPASM domain-containing protein, partial [Chloroflexota bacterium]
EMEFNGDVYSCDHYVEPTYKLGNIIDIPLSEIVVMDKQIEFGLAKRDTLPNYCRQCDVRFVCNGGCPKNRFINTPDGEAGLNYLCAGYKAFFTHVDVPMRFMTNELAHHRPPSNVMRFMKQADTAREATFEQAKRNDLCPCGSGIKFKRCHGRLRRANS